MIGNPLNDGRWTYTWEHGRQLASITDGNTTVDYVYNADGLRTQKTVTTPNSHTHVFQNTVVAPTCTENGYTLHSCVCGYIYQDAPVAATGHTFTTKVVEATCTENGYVLKECACGYSYQEGSGGHSFTTLVVEPTETVNGFTLHECECGYSYESDPVASLGAATAASEDSVSDTKVYDYVYNGSSLVYLTITTTAYGESPATETLYFGNGTVTYNEVVYYYVTNLQGDVVAILDTAGTAVVEYTYDAWGNILSTTGSMANTLGVANPLTYRGYVYDDESELYYLQSRYYDPEVGRFINADALVSTGQGLLGNNMFAYCGNNPPNRIDATGCFWQEFLDELIRLIQENVAYFTASAGVSQIDTPALGPADVASLALLAAGVIACAGVATCTTLQKHIDVAVNSSIGQKSFEDELGNIAFLLSLWDNTMTQNVMYNKTDLIDVANENCVAAAQRAAYQNTLCSPGIGAEPQQARKNTRSASAVRVFFCVCGYTCLACQLRICIYANIACQ